MRAYLEKECLEKECLEKDFVMLNKNASQLFSARHFFSLINVNERHFPHLIVVLSTSG